MTYNVGSPSGNQFRKSNGSKLETVLFGVALSVMLLAGRGDYNERHQDYDLRNSGHSTIVQDNPITSESDSLDTLYPGISYGR
jgi:hypothetical protein